MERCRHVGQGSGVEDSTDIVEIVPWTIPRSTSSRLARELASNSTGKLINWKATVAPKAMMPIRTGLSRAKPWRRR